MKHVFFTLVALLIASAAQATGTSQPGNVKLFCQGVIEETSGDFERGFSRKPVKVSIKIGGPVYFRYGTRMVYDQIEVIYKDEIIQVKEVRGQPEFSLYEKVDLYENLLLTDLNWYQSIQYSDGTYYSTRNQIQIVGLPKTVNTTGDGRYAQDGDTHSTFSAEVKLFISNGEGKVDYTAHVAGGVMNCVYDQTFPKP